MKRAIIVVGALAGVLVAYVVAGPFLTLHRIKAAIVAQDAGALSENIDFPVLRQNLKDQINAAMMKSAAADLKGNPFAGLATVFASGLAERMVDSFVTPAGLGALMEGEGMRTRQADTAAGTAGAVPAKGRERPQPLEGARYTFDSASRFSAWVPGADGQEIRFVLAREGLGWKLSNIIIPGSATAALEGGQQTGSGRPPGSPTAPGAWSAVKIVDVSSEVTESNDVWWKYSWRLTVANSGSEPATVDAKIDFLDKGGFIVDEDTKAGLTVPPASQRTFAGYDLVDASAAPNVKSVRAKLSPAFP